MRYLLIAAIVWLVIWYWRRSTQELPPSRPGNEPLEARMVQCERCGVYLPLAEALKAGEAYYCTPEHRDGPSEGEQ